MGEAEVEILRGYELRLLRCTFSPPPSDHQIPSHHHHPLHSHINHLLSFIEAGDYLQALSSDAARLLLHSTFSHFTDSADRVYSELIERVESFLVNDSVDDYEIACKVVLVMCLAIAAFLWFTQCNLTGPLERLSNQPIPIEVSEGRELVEWDNWARNQLMSAGSDLLGKFSNLQYIVFAKMLLMRTKDLLFEGSVLSTYGIRSISWWLVRLLVTHQRILDERSSSLFDLLQVYMGETLNHFGTLEKVASYWGAKLNDGEASDIVAMAHLEAGILGNIYGLVDSCKKHFELAEVAARLQISVTGVLGFRTVHQVEPKAQMVLLTRTSLSETGGGYLPISPGIQTIDSGVGEVSDILKTPKLLETCEGSGIQNGGAAAPLNPIQQAVILGQCLLIEKRARHDDMQRWDMAPYIEAIDSQLSSYYILQCFRDILRVRWESTRGRTKERALQMMDKLVEGVNKHHPEVAQRIPYCFVVYVPTIPALRKEYGDLLVNCGLIGEAITIFESIELWDNLIYCNCLLGKKAAAVELIKTRLSERPNDPRLWCSLGDVTNNDACYEKAVEVSNNRSARAKRSLARSAYNRGDYETSKILWESAMALNSLYPDGWFALGAAALKARDVEKALDGFIRAIQLDPENGEAWNNIACLHMIKKKSKESFIAFKEALKFKRNSWQLWENYSQVAMDVGNVVQALEAIQMVLEITSNKRIDVELLERIMLEMERRTSTKHFVPFTVTNDHNGTRHTGSTDSSVDFLNESENAEVMVGRSRETGHLMELLGKVLQQIVRRGGTGDIWGLYATWHKMKGDLTMCREALLKQVRSYQGSDLWKDRDRFKKFARASLDLCEVYMEISTSTGSHRELVTAEMHLRNILRQAGIFSDMEEFKNLQACLEKVNMKLQSNLVPT
ncbi:TPR_11 domain-containing protein [Cephalotus follicularis]|uniref:TPR_11 domain-containing protein n=1 Tax=Cephalotus follicularis TaxID=3775 RepID=A0A1Q3B1C1_CEPFO|nr:TPR_11 domain-containing protein [Cephalotus follicularis]